MLYCGECKTNFLKPSNMRAHVIRKHPDKVDMLVPKKGKHSQFVKTCLECNKTFASLGNLRQHIKRQHPDKLEELAPIKKNNYKCPYCSEHFEVLKYLSLHKKNHKAVKKLKCPLCDYTDACRETLILHYRNYHFLQICNETHQFKSFDDFQVWKSKLEEETFSSFVNMYGVKKRANSTTITYNCHRSGEFKSKGKNLRKLKTQGSNKINGNCPAKMNVIIKENKCEVKFCKSHVGHRQEQDLGHLFLSKSQRHNVAAKIGAKIPFQTILDETRDSVSNFHLERLHLLTKKDLYNIEQCFKLNDSAVRHANDAISVEAWVHEMKENDSVLFYKHQESVSEEYPELKPEDFLLIIMTEGQKDLMLRFGEDCICIDGTHGLNGYGFELHTILILDDLREGYPSAFLISNRSDSIVMKVFFACVEERIGQKIKPKIFMSDMADAYYNAWVQVMEPAEFRLFCTWHVDRAWRKNIEKVADKEKKVHVYQMLRTILQERDVAAFTKLLHEFVTQCKEDPDTLEFANYFQQHYVCKVEQWAYCFRLHCGLNTNMHIERMHRTIKHLYLNGKFVKRLDKAICAIMKFVRDKLFERLIVIHKGKVCTKLYDLRNKHKNSETLNINTIVKTDMGWMVPSSSSTEIYVVEELKLECSCKLTCNECHVCLHRYSCTCLDSSIRWNMCKHIHLVCRYLQKQPINITTEIEAPQSDDLVIDSDNQTTALVNAISTNRPTNSSQDVFQEEKQKFIQQLCDELDKNVTSLEELQAVKRITAPIKPTLDAIKSQISHVPMALMASSTKKTPQNKNIILQRRLFSTKKINKKKPNDLRKPSADVANVLAVKMLYTLNDK